MIPGIIYGLKKGNIPIQFENNQIVKKMTKDNSISKKIHVDISNIKHEVKIHDIQFDKISDDVIHIDFLRE